MPCWREGEKGSVEGIEGLRAFLNVHEGPHGMSLMRKTTNEVGLQEGMTLSNEPGYYEEGAFGIRHENVLVIRKALPHLCRLAADGENVLVVRKALPHLCRLVADGENVLVIRKASGVRHMDLHTAAPPPQARETR
eukprot:1195335-Prorocentrum_minimum.AAC.7